MRAKALYISLSLILSFVVGSHYVATSVARVDPEFMLRSNWFHPAAVAAVMNKKLGKPGGPVFSAYDAFITRDALRRAPTNRTLLRTIGVIFDLKGESAQAYSAMALADKLTRRDQVTQLWLAEYSRRAGYSREALKHYHAAMAVHPELEPIVFPAMVSLLGDQKFGKELVKYIEFNYPWAPRFVTFAVTRAPDTILPILLAGATPANRKAYADQFAELIGHQALASDREQIGIMIERFYTAKLKDSLTSGGWVTQVAGETIDLGRLSWSFTDRPGLNSFVDEDGRLVLDMGATAGGLVAQRDVILGDRRSISIRHQIDTADGGFGAKGRWMASCIRTRADVRPLTQAFAVRSRTEYVHTDFQFGSACRLVRLQLELTPPDTQFDVRFGLASLKLIVR